MLICLYEMRFIILMTRLTFASCLHLCYHETDRIFHMHAIAGFIRQQGGRNYERVYNETAG